MGCRSRVRPQVLRVVRWSLFIYSMRLPPPIDSLSRVSLWTVAVACPRSRAPLSVFYLFPLVFERSRRWLVTCCVDCIAAASGYILSYRRWFLSSPPPRRLLSVTGIVDLVVFALYASWGLICLLCPACEDYRSRRPPSQSRVDVAIIVAANTCSSLSCTAS